MVFVIDLVEGEIIFEDIECHIIYRIVSKQGVTLFDHGLKSQQIKSFKKRATIFWKFCKRNKSFSC